jgi:hypothetical protein
MSVRRAEAWVRAAVPSPLRRLLHPLRVQLDPASPKSTRRKRATIRRYAKRFGTPVLVETGTYRGTTVRAMRRHFARIYSIELDDGLYERARRRFATDRHVEILHGDSGVVLPSLLKRIDDSCLFWLDGHFSDWGTARGATGSPLRRELDAVLGRRHEHDVVLIDDARSLGGFDGYPTLEELRALVRAARPEFVLEVRDDIVRIHPPR